MLKNNTYAYITSHIYTAEKQKSYTFSCASMACFHNKREPRSEVRVCFSPRPDGRDDYLTTGIAGGFYHSFFVINTTSPDAMRRGMYSILAFFSLLFVFRPGLTAGTI